MGQRGREGILSGMPYVCCLPVCLRACESGFELHVLVCVEDSCLSVCLFACVCVLVSVDVSCMCLCASACVHMFRLPARACAPCARVRAYVSRDAEERVCVCLSGNVRVRAFALANHFLNYFLIKYTGFRNKSSSNGSSRRHHTDHIRNDTKNA